MANHHGKKNLCFSVKKNKQGSVTPRRSLPLCFIGLICCLTSLSPSDYCYIISYFPSAASYPSTSPFHLLSCLILRSSSLGRDTFSRVTVDADLTAPYCSASVFAHRKPIMRRFIGDRHLWCCSSATPVPPTNQRLRKLCLLPLFISEG